MGVPGVTLLLLLLLLLCCYTLDSPGRSPTSPASGAAKDPSRSVARQLSVLLQTATCGRATWARCHKLQH
jgi:hypothetical protein